MTTSYKTPTFLRYWLVVYLNFFIIQLCFGITCGRVLNGELYAQRLQKITAFVYRLFHEGFSAIIETNIVCLFRQLERNLHETVGKQMQLN